MSAPPRLHPSCIPAPSQLRPGPDWRQWRVLDPAEEFGGRRASLAADREAPRAESRALSRIYIKAS